MSASDPRAFDAEGEMSTELPHVRLAALRLRALGRDMNEALRTPPTGEIAPDAPLSAWLRAITPRAHGAVLRLAQNMQHLAGQLLTNDRTLTVARVNDGIDAIREDFLALLALRDAAALRTYAGAERGFADEAAQRIARRIGGIADFCAAIGDGILMPERAMAGLELSVDLDLAHELQIIASRAQGPVAIWRYC